MRPVSGPDREAGCAPSAGRTGKPGTPRQRAGPGSRGRPVSGPDREAGGPVSGPGPVSRPDAAPERDAGRRSRAGSEKLVTMRDTLAQLNDS